MLPAQTFLQSGATLCWVPSTLCGSTMAAMGPGEVARVGPGGTAVCLSGPRGAYTSTGNSIEQPAMVRTRYIKNLFFFFLACCVHIANAWFKPIFSFLVFTPGSSRVRSSISANLQKRTNVLFTVTMDNSQFSLSCKICRLALPNVLKTLAGSTLEDTKRDDWNLFIYLFILYFEDHSAVWRGCFDLAVQASRSISEGLRAKLHPSGERAGGKQPS